MTAKLYTHLFETVSSHLSYIAASDLLLSNYTSTFNLAKERHFHCISYNNLKDLELNVSTHADEYTTFLCFLAHQAYLDGFLELAQLVYLVNRRLNHFDCYYTRQIPDIFRLVHPIGSVLGQATYSNYLVIYQGVTVGGDPKLRYPYISESVVLFSNSSILGDCSISSNCAVGAGVQLYGTNVVENTAVSFRPPQGNVHSSLNWDVRSRFFSSSF